MAEPKQGGEGGEQQAPVIIVKKGGHGGHHGGAWKVAYADFVTSMMSLFIVLWLTAQSQEVKEAVGGYFRDPGAFMKQTRGGVLDGASVLPEQGGGEVAKAPPTPEELHRAQEQAFEQAAAKLRESLSGMPGFKDLEGQVEIKVTELGLNVQLVEKSGSLLFDVGSANLGSKLKEILGILGPQIGELPNRIAIEGHTDSRPYPAGAAYTNWELAADRANSARRFLLEHGLRPEQLAEVRGYADTRLRNPSDPTDIANRRISITVMYTDAGEGGGGAGPAAATASPAPFTLPSLPAAAASAAGGGGGHGTAPGGHH